jgi:hypothetical protein
MLPLLPDPIGLVEGLDRVKIESYEGIEDTTDEEVKDIYINMPRYHMPVTLHTTHSVVPGVSLTDSIIQNIDSIVHVKK